MSCSFRTVVLTAALTVALVFHYAVAADIVVGPNGSWELSTDYETWVSSQTFTTGDNLIFRYTAGQHNVLEVTEANYDSCGASGPINTFATGDDSIALSSAGTRYFICGFPGHCSGGMKLAVTTTAGSSGAASPPPPTTTTPSSPTPPTTTTPSSPTPPATTTPPPSTNPIPGDQAPSPNSGAKVASSVGLLAVLFALVV